MKKFKGTKHTKMGRALLSNMISILSIMFAFIFIFISPGFATKDIPKIVVWDLTPGNIPASYTQDLTALLVSEIARLKKYEVYSQDNVRTLAGWTAEKMKLGCTDTQCLTALGQIDVEKLISGRVGKIGTTYLISLNLFDTRNARAENAVSESCQSEDELIGKIQQAAIKLLGLADVGPSPLVPAVSKGPKPGEPFKDTVTGMEFVFVKGGCFEMGDTFGDGISNEKPVHEVCVNNFWMGKYEVTQGQWERIMGSNPSHFKRGSNYPVEQVSWNDVQNFIQRLNQQTGKRFRLPTEAEWEYAARSGGKREKWSGTSSESELGEYAWCYVNSGSSTHPVGQKRPNGLGLFDMGGNVWEWCQDWYDEGYYGKSPRINPEGPSSGQYKVLRGGSWVNNPWFVRASARVWLDPTYRSSSTGFRLVLPSE
jgi:formylglycine-generating enzyme required for sulfatase activity